MSYSMQQNILCIISWCLERILKVSLISRTRNPGHLLINVRGKFLLSVYLQSQSYKSGILKQTNLGNINDGLYFFLLYLTKSSYESYTALYYLDIIILKNINCVSYPHPLQEIKMLF